MSQLTHPPSPVTIILCNDDLFFSDGQTARAKASPSVGNYLVDIKSFEQLALPTIKLSLNKSKVNKFTQYSSFLSLLCDRQLASRAQPNSVIRNQEQRIYQYRSSSGSKLYLLNASSQTLSTTEMLVNNLTNSKTACMIECFNQSGVSQRNRYQVT